jgi:hypothetical protein
LHKDVERQIDAFLEFTDESITAVRITPTASAARGGKS